MKSKNFLIALLLVCSVATTTIMAAANLTNTSTRQLAKETKEQTVYICTGGSAYAYHKDRKCKYLNKCSKEIKAVAESEALKMNRKPCKGCTK